MTDDALIPLPEVVDAPVPTSPRRVARVAVDVPLAHLDRFFDYEVPEFLDEIAVPGARVRVRFAGRQVDGFVIERVTDSDVAQLAPVSKVVSAEPVLAPEIVTLVRRVADHYAGVFADVVRLAVPPRHARTEKAAHEPLSRPELGEPGGPLLAYPTGAELLQALERGDSPRAAWHCAPVHDGSKGGGPGDWARAFAHAALATRRSGRSSILLAPDGADLVRLRAACDEVLGTGSWVEISHSAGPAERYRAFLAALRGETDVVIGPRAAVWAPVHRLGLVALWDDGDDSWAEDRAPAPHSREVACLRATSCGLLLGGHTRTTEVEALVERGWIMPLALPPDGVRRVSPVVRAAVDHAAQLDRDPRAAMMRLPPSVFTTIRQGLVRGPVLVQVPRAGGRQSLVCECCREPARCQSCGGPLVEPTEPGQLVCHWCARAVSQLGWACPVCGSTRLRSRQIGAARTATELGRAFPGVNLISSHGGHPVEQVGADPALVVATPGSEPWCDSGYAAAVLLDGEVMMSRADLRVAEETLRRWTSAEALVVPAQQGGTVTVVAPQDNRVVQALIRHDPSTFAAHELSERASAGYPPAVKMVLLEGEPGPVGDVVRGLELPLTAEVLGPVEVPLRGRGALASDAEPHHRYLLRAPLIDGKELVGAVKVRLVRRSADKASGALRVRVDPAIIAF